MLTKFQPTLPTYPHHPPSSACLSRMSTFLSNLTEDPDITNLQKTWHATSAPDRRRFVHRIATRISPLVRLVGTIIARIDDVENDDATPLTKNTNTARESPPQALVTQLGHATSLLTSLCWTRDTEECAPVAHKIVVDPSFRSIVAPVLVVSDEDGEDDERQRSNALNHILNLLYSIVHAGGSLSIEIDVQDDDGELIRAILCKMAIADPRYSESAAGIIHGLAKKKNIPSSLRQEVIVALQNVVTSSSSQSSSSRTINTAASASTSTFASASCSDNDNGGNDPVLNVTRGSACQAALAMAYLIGGDEESFFVTNPDAVRNLVYVTDLACRNESYAGHSWEVYWMFRAMEAVVISDANVKVLADCGFIDLVLHFLGTLYRKEQQYSPAAYRLEEDETGNGAFSAAVVDLMARLSPAGLDMNSHRKNFPLVPAYVSNYDALRLSLQLTVRLSLSPTVATRLRSLGAKLEGFLHLIAGACSTNEVEEVSGLVDRLRFALDVVPSDDGGEARATDGPVRHWRRPPGERPVPGRWRGHVMVSCSRAERNGAEAFVRCLRSHGHRVYLDTGRTEMDVVEVAGAVIEDVDAVVVCVSRSYKKSLDCRLEAVYADRLGKPIVLVRMDGGYYPKGWLGLLVGGRSCYDGMRPEEAAEEVSRKELCGSVVPDHPDGSATVVGRTGGLDAKSRTVSFPPSHTRSPIQKWGSGILGRRRSMGGSERKKSGKSVFLTTHN